MRRLNEWHRMVSILGLALGLSTGVLAQTRFIPDGGRGDTLYVGEVFAGQGEVVRRLTLRLQAEGGQQARIEQVYSSCECAVPSWPREAFSDGDTLTLRVLYTPSGKPGPFIKTLTLYSADRKPLGRVYLKGSLIEPPLTRETPTKDQTLDRVTRPQRPVRGRPLSIELRQAYNDTTVTLTTDQVEALRALGRGARIVITGVASRVPTETFGTNRTLAQARSRAARRVVEGVMDGLSPLVIEQARIAGPLPDASAAEERYAPYQYVLIEGRSAYR